MKRAAYWRNKYFSVGLIILFMLFISACTPDNGETLLNPPPPSGTAPTITSANNTKFTVGTVGTFTVTATVTPTPTVAITGTLPSGVTFDITTGVLSGIPAAGSIGTYPLTITASNGVFPNASQNLTLTVQAASKSWGTAALIETNDSGVAIEPQVTFDAFGNAVAVWMQYDDVSGRYNIWSNRYTASTGLWGTAVAISNNVGSAQSPQVAVDANGNAIAVWHQDDGHTNIYTNRYTASTGLWGIAALLETNDAGYAYYPQVAIDAYGNAIVVWYQNVGYPYNIWSNRYTASTNSWSGAAKIETNTAGNALNPQIAIDANGNVVAVWQQYDDVASRYDIWSNRYTASTGIWSTASPIETDNAGWATQPQVVFDTSGNAVAVWMQSDGSRYNIWSNRYIASTGLWGMAVLLETDNTGDANNPQIAVDAHGNAVAVWMQSDGSRYNIWSNRYIASTGLWGTAVLLETDNTGDANEPQVAIDTNGNAVAVWLQSDGQRTTIWSNMYR